MTSTYICFYFPCAIFFPEYVNHRTAPFFPPQRAEPRKRPRIHPFEETARTAAMFLAQHRYIERIKRHRMTSRHNESMTGSQLLNSDGSEMPEMAGDIVCRPIFTVTSCIIGRAVGHCHNEHPFLCQQFTKHFPCFIEVFQMLHHVPKGDHIKATGSKLFQSRFGFYVQIEMLLCKSTCLRTFLHCFHLPSTACHGVGEVSGSRPDIEQTPSLRCASLATRRALRPSI